MPAYEEIVIWTVLGAINAPGWLALLVWPVVRQCTLVVHDGGKPAHLMSRMPERRREKWWHNLDGVPRLFSEGKS